MPKLELLFRAARNTKAQSRTLKKKLQNFFFFLQSGLQNFANLH